MSRGRCFLSTSPPIHHSCAKTPPRRKKVGMTAEFSIGLHGQRGDAAAGEFLDLHATVACRGFAGQTKFSIARRDLAAFTADLAKLRQATADSAQLLGGWDDARERLRLLMTPAGRS